MFFVNLNYENCWQRGLSMHLHRTILKLRSLVEKIKNVDRDVYWRNNGSIVNVNIIQRVSNKWILLKVTCGGRAGASPEWTVPTAPGVCVCVCVCVCALGWVKYRKHISLLVILCIIVYVTNKNNYGKMLKYQEKYRYIGRSLVLLLHKIQLHS